MYIEGIQERVKIMQRRLELSRVLQLSNQFFLKGRYKNLPMIDGDPLLEYISQLVENAYIAGANGVGENENRITDTGPVKVLAGNYCKNKGLRL